MQTSSCGHSLPAWTLPKPQAQLPSAPALRHGWARQMCAGPDWGLCFQPPRHLPISRHQNPLPGTRAQTLGEPGALCPVCCCRSCSLLLPGPQPLTLCYPEPCGRLQPGFCFPGTCGSHPAPRPLGPRPLPRPCPLSSSLASCFPPGDPASSHTCPNVTSPPAVLATPLKCSSASPLPTPTLCPSLSPSHTRVCMHTRTCAQGWHPSSSWPVPRSHRAPPPSDPWLLLFRVSPHETPAL